MLLIDVLPNTIYAREAFFAYVTSRYGLAGDLRAIRPEPEAPGLRVLSLGDRPLAVPTIASRINPSFVRTPASFFNTPGRFSMKRKRHRPEQIIKKLREADAMLASDKTIGQVCQALEVSEQTFHRWRAQYGGMKAGEAKNRIRKL